MAVFKYKGKNRQGREVTGEVEAENKEAAQKSLRNQQVIVLFLKAKPKDIEIKIPGFSGKIKDKDIIIFTKQLATMINAGLPLVQSLSVLAVQSENKELAKDINQIRGDVETGLTFNDALRKHPKAFNDLYTNMIEAGEIGGILDTILGRLCIYIEKSMLLKKRIKSAMVYPSVVLAVALIIVTGLLIFVIPTFAKMFQDMGGAALPLPTQIVINLSRFIASWTGGGLVLGAVIVLIIVIKLSYKSKKGKMAFHRLFLRLPVVGMLIRKVAVAKFSRTLSTLLSSGVPILDGLDIVARTAGNMVVEESIMKAKIAISEGKTITEPLEQSKIFPMMVTQMISIGETTGALDTMLTKIADFYDEEVDSAVGVLTSMLEPMLMVFLGIVVGFIVVAMYLPIFKMAGNIV
ncbi:MAG: type II secretion system F family protein [bacterium]